MRKSYKLTFILKLSTEFGLEGKCTKELSGYICIKRILKIILMEKGPASSLY